MLQFRRKQRTNLGISSQLRHFLWPIYYFTKAYLKKKKHHHTHTDTNFLSSDHGMSKHSYTSRDPLSSCTIAQATAYNTQNPNPKLSVSSSATSP